MQKHVLSAVALLTMCSSISGTAHAKNWVGDAVVLRALDKVTATTKDYTVKVGEALTYGALRVDVKHCETRPPEEVPETYAFLQIFETKLDGKGQAGEEEKAFSGWMMSSNPAISALDHPVYDIWVLGCQVKRQAPETIAPLTDDAGDTPSTGLR